MHAAESAQLASWMERVADGDRAAFTPLFRALEPRVRALCRSLLGHEQDAEDAVQLAMEKIFVRAADYERGRAVLPWALAVAAWECRGLRQKRVRRREHALEAESPLATAADLDRGAAQTELARAALHALESLSAPDREVLFATFWDEARARVAGATVRKRRERALTRLRLAFRRLYGLD